MRRRTKLWADIVDRGLVVFLYGKLLVKNFHM